MRTLWTLLVGARAGLILLWRAKRSGRSFKQQLAYETMLERDRLAIRALSLDLTGSEERSEIG